MGASFSICGTCNNTNEINRIKENEKEIKIHYIDQIIKTKTEMILLKTEYLEKHIDNTKEELKNNLSETKTDLRMELKELKNDLITLINFIDDKRVKLK